MESVRRLASAAMLWAALFAGVAVLAVAWHWGGAAISRFAAMADGIPAGPKLQPTVEELRRSQAAWKRRHVDPAERYTPEQLGPSPQAVIEAIGRKGYPSPPDVLEPEQ